MSKVLESLGFVEHEVKIYTYLAFYGPRRVKEIVSALEIYKRKAYRTVKRLQIAGLIIVSDGVPAVVSAVSFDKVLEQFTKSNTDQVNQLEKEKEKILSIFQHGTREEIEL